MEAELRHRLESPEAFRLFYRALADGEESGWADLYRRYHALAASWVRRHPEFRRTGESPEFFVNAAFTKMMAAMRSARFAGFDDVPAMLGYLRMCAKSAVVDQLRRRTTRRNRRRRAYRTPRATPSATSSARNFGEPSHMSLSPPRSVCSSTNRSSTGRRQSRSASDGPNSSTPSKASTRTRDTSCRGCGAIVASLTTVVAPAEMVARHRRARTESQAIPRTRTGRPQGNLRRRNDDGPGGAGPSSGGGGRRLWRVRRGRFHRAHFTTRKYPPWISGACLHRRGFLGAPGWRRRVGGRRRDGARRNFVRLRRRPLRPLLREPLSPEPFFFLARRFHLHDHVGEHHDPWIFRQRAPVRVQTGSRDRLRRGKRVLVQTCFVFVGAPKDRPAVQRAPVLGTDAIELGPILLDDGAMTVTGADAFAPELVQRLPMFSHGPASVPVPNL